MVVSLFVRKLKHLISMSKNVDYKKMIQSKRWKVLRKKKINANPICEDCMERNIVEPATEVHHVIPAETALSVDEMEGLMFDYANLRSLCQECHANAHVLLGSKKRENVRENCRRVTERFAKRYF